MEKELEIPMLAGVAGNKTTFALTFFNRVLVTRTPKKPTSSTRKLR
jgi:hypothetical protein